MTPLQLSLLIVHVGATVAMVGIIWFVQIVHYPLLAFVGSAEFVRYEVTNCRATTIVVAPLMLAELSSAILLTFSLPPLVSRTLLLTGLLLLVLIWASTIAIQVPLHQRLSESHDPAAQRRLVRSNWLRTAGWSLRGLLALWMTFGLIPLAT